MQEFIFHELYVNISSAFRFLSGYSVTLLDEQRQHKTKQKCGINLYVFMIGSWIWKQNHFVFSSFNGLVMYSVENMIPVV